MCSAFRSCRLYSWMRLICVSKIVSGSTTWPVADLSQSANRSFGLALGLANRGAERLVVGQRLELLELVEIGDPAVADGVGDHRGERRIGEQQEAPLA